MKAMNSKSIDKFNRSSRAKGTVSNGAKDGIKNYVINLDDVDKFISKMNTRYNFMLVSKSCVDNKLFVRLHGYSRDGIARVVLIKNIPDGIGVVLLAPDGSILLLKKILGDLLLSRSITLFNYFDRHLGIKT